jgi:D-glycero-D-manno-heptose 1,7-bisphosphate phosphatase
MGNQMRFPFSELNLPGKILTESGLPQRPFLVAFDRDGTLIEYVPYLRRIQDIRVIPEAVEAVRLLNEVGVFTAIITNQSVVGRKELSSEGLEEIHSKISELFALGGASFSNIYSCTHISTAGCSCRKPRPDLFLEACGHVNVDPTHSWVVGDNSSDMLLAHAAGARGVRVLTGVKVMEDETHWLVANNALDAVHLILRQAS